MHFPRITTQQSRTPPPPPDRPTDRSVVRSGAHPSVVRVASRRPRATRRTRAVDGRRCTHKNTPRSSRSRLARPIVARATNASSSPVHPDRVSPSRIAPASRLGGVFVVVVVVASRPPTPSTASSTNSERTNAIVIASRVHIPRGASAERVAVGARANPCEVRATIVKRRVVRVEAARSIDRSIDRGGCDDTLIDGDRVRGMRVMVRDRTRGTIVVGPSIDRVVITLVIIGTYSSTTYSHQTCSYSVRTVRPPPI